MSALRKAIDESCNQAHADRVDNRVFEAKPVKGNPDFKDMRAKIKSRFSKTMAYLAK